MKTQSLNKRAIGILISLGLSFTSLQSLGQYDDNLLAETESVFNSEQIDVDGRFRRDSAADKLAKLRKNLEKQNEDLVQKKIEDIRVANETKLTGQLQNALKSGFGGDRVSVGHAAVKKSTAKLPTIFGNGESKIIPSTGLKQFNGDQIDSYSSKANLALAFESNITPRFSMGIVGSYTTVEEQDLRTLGFNTATFGQIKKYKSIGVALNSKFFFTVDSKVRPFIGAELGYSINSVKLNEDDDQFYAQQFNYRNAGNEDVNGNHVTGSIFAGAEVNFSQTIGLSADVRFKKALSSGFDQRSANQGFNGGFLNESQVDRELRSFGAAIEDSDEISVNFGLIVRF